MGPRGNRTCIFPIRSVMRNWAVCNHSYSEANLNKWLLGVNALPKELRTYDLRTLRQAEWASTVVRNKDA